MCEAPILQVGSLPVHTKSTLILDKASGIRSGDPERDKMYRTDRDCSEGSWERNSDRGLIKSESRQDSCLQVIQGVVTRCPQGHQQEAAEGYVCVFSNQAISAAYVVL